RHSASSFSRLASMMAIASGWPSSINSIDVPIRSFRETGMTGCALLNFAPIPDEIPDGLRRCRGDELQKRPIFVRKRELDGFGRADPLAAGARTCAAASAFDFGYLFFSDV